MEPFFPIQKSILSCEAIRENILTLYELGQQNYTCRFITHGANDTYRIAGEYENYYLRIYRFNWRSKDDILSEIKLLCHLQRNKKISVAWPINKIDGEYITEIKAPEGIRYAVLFKSAIGESKLLNPKRSFNYGRMLAIIHTEADALEKLDRFHIDLKYLLDEPLKSIRPFLSKREEDCKYLEIISKDLGSKISMLLSKDKSSYGLCHGDFHGGNIFFDSEDNISVFDFDCFGYGWRAYDISVFLWSCGSSVSWRKRDKNYRIRLWNSFIKGYTEIRELTNEEQEAAFVFVPIRHIWLLGLHTHGCDDWGGNWINDEYFNRHILFLKKWIKHYDVLSRTKKLSNLELLLRKALKFWPI